MKRLRYLFGITLFTLISTINVQGQAHLKILSLINFPDTAFNGQVAPVTIVIQNIGTAPFQGVVSVAIQVDSPSTGTGLLYFGSQPTIILPLDTSVLTPPNGFLFDNNLFKPGNNVVVVWPYSTQAVIVDTLTTQVYYFNVAGVDQLTNSNSFSIYPNPTSNKINLKSNDKIIESVRIFNLEGQSISNFLHVNNTRIQIDISDFPTGIYLIQLDMMDGRRSYLRCIKN